MKNKIIAIDLGGTLLRVALVKKNKIIRYIKRETPKNKNELLNLLFNSIEELIDKNVKGIGIGSPGPLKDGVIKNPPNIPFKNFNLKQAVENKFKIRTEINNDAGCVAIAESKLGCKKKNFIVMTIGTGIGGGIVIDGKVYTGEGYGGELGHIVIHDGKYLEKLWKKTRQDSLKFYERILLIDDLLKLKDKNAKKIVKEASSYLGQGIASIINIFDPEIVILSGGIKETGSVFLNMIKKEVEKYSVLPKKTPISWTSIKHPGILGASLLIS